MSFDIANARPTTDVTSSDQAVMHNIDVNAFARFVGSVHIACMLIDARHGIFSGGCKCDVGRDITSVAIGRHMSEVIQLYAIGSRLYAFVDIDSVHFMAS